MTLKINDIQRTISKEVYRTYCKNQLSMLDTIIHYFKSINPVLAAFYASLFTWVLTALGASFVFI